jgi:hypothetical protein
VPETDDEPSESSALGELVGNVLTELYETLSGHSPKAVRVYSEDDALLLLLRFDPVELAEAADATGEPLADKTLIALPDMIAAAVQRRAGRTLFPGNVSVAAERGLAVFGFCTVAEPAPAPKPRVLFASLTPPSPEPADALGESPGQL